jgi:hypothetical protein
MNLSQRILRLFSRKNEDQRMAFRMAINMASATAEDLNRAACFMADEFRCTGKIPVDPKGRKPA